MNKIAIGYIASHPFWDGAYLPQRVQNHLVRMYCEKNQLKLIWSMPEVSVDHREMPALKNFFNGSNQEVNAVVFISYQMNEPSQIINFTEKLLSKSVVVHFVMENLCIQTQGELEELSPEIRLANLLRSSEKITIVETISKSNEEGRV